MKITDELIEHAAALSRLRIGPEEKEQIAGELEAILSCMEILNDLDTDGMSPVSHVLPLKNVFRRDEVVPSRSRADMLGQTPHRDDEAFIVPKTVE